MKLNKRLLTTIVIVFMFCLVSTLFYVNFISRKEAEPAATTNESAMVTSIQQTSQEPNQQPVLAPLTTEQKLEDFEYMYNLIKDNYPFLKVNQRLTGVDWLANKEKYIAKIKSSKDDSDFFSYLTFILRDLHNGHTTMLHLDDYKLYKEIFTRDEQKKYHEPWLAELNKKTVVDRYAQKKVSFYYTPVTVESDPLVTTEIIEKNKLAYMRVPALVGINSDMKVIKPFLQQIKNYNALIIDIRGNRGGDSTYWYNYLVPMLVNKPVTWTEYLLYRVTPFSEPYIKAKLGDYYNLHPIDRLNQEHLDQLPPEAFTDFNNFSKNVQTIAPIDSVGFKGKIYLLVDHQVASSAEAWANFAKETGWATLVGEQTGGDGIGWEGALPSLPNSGYMFRLELTFGLNSHGAADEEVKIQPDVVSDVFPIGPSDLDPAIATVKRLESVKE
ncbi:S41 family peptidase [Paenibacillus caui]|uniref:S41 family peptidase n=1 Tax=Paenibacillus caui TaxID=2873927 RepID=UPI001CA7FA95|nr:S41 family peptidase [Paenibacillus caui]